MLASLVALIRVVIIAGSARANSDILGLAMFGFFQVAGLTLFFVGSRLLPSGQSALIATLETPLMPFWIWLAFDETPVPRALIGGVLVMGAVIADIAGDMRAQRAAASPTG